MGPEEELELAHAFGEVRWTGEGWDWAELETCDFCVGSGDLMAWDGEDYVLETCERCDGEGEARPRLGFPDPGCRCLGCERARRV